MVVIVAKGCEKGSQVLRGLRQRNLMEAAVSV